MLPDQPLTPLEEAFLEAVRPSARGRGDVLPAVDVLAHPGVTAPQAPGAGPLEAHGCLHAAVVVDSKGNRVWYPCRSHDGDMHNFAAHWPKCPAPWCRLPYSHYLKGTMHDIPGGRAEYHDHIGVVVDRG
jgi:hypothetical protein